MVKAYASDPARAVPLTLRVQSVGRNVIEACWLVALVSVPLLVNPLGESTVSLYKAAFFRTLVGVMVALWALKTGLSLRVAPEAMSHRVAAARAAAMRFLKTPLMAPVLALALVYVLATVLSVSPSTSLWGAWSRMDGTYTMLALVAFFLVLSWELRTAAQVDRIVWAIVGTATLVASLGITERLGWSPWLVSRPYGDWRIGATTGHPILLGSYLILTTALLLGNIVQFWLSTRGRLGRTEVWTLASLGVLLFVQLTAMLLTNARGPWLGLVAMVLVFVVVLFVKNRRWGLVRLVMALLALGIVFQVGLSQRWIFFDAVSDLPYLSRMADLTDMGSGSGRHRVVIWSAATDLVVNHPTITPTPDRWHWARPILGYGPETLKWAFEAVFPAELRHLEPGPRVDRAHNVVLDLMVTTGVLGVLAFGSVVGVFLFYATRALKGAKLVEEQPMLVALIAAVAGYLVALMVGITSLTDQLVFWTVLALIVATTRGVPWLEGAQRRRPVPVIEDTQDRGGTGLLLPTLVSSAVALVAVAFSLYVNGNLVSADLQSRKGVDLTLESRWGEAASVLEGALHSPPLLELNHWRLAGLYAEQVLEEVVSTDQLGLLELAGEHIEQARALAPASAAPHMKAGLIYGYWALTLDPGKYGAAVQAFATAAVVSPNEVSIYNQWADLEAKSGNHEKAFVLLHRSLELDPEWAPTYHQMGKVYEMMAQPDETATAYRRSIELSPTFWEAYLDLAKVLVSSGNLVEARPYAEQFVQAQPAHWEGRFVVATLYRDLGMTREARK